jgi:uncharacterized membrane protein
VNAVDLQRFCPDVKQNAAMGSWVALSLLFHLVGLALWVGAIAFFLVVFAPAAHDLPPYAGLHTLNHGRIFLEAISWMGIALLLVSGITNMVLRQQPGTPADYFYPVILSIKLFLFVAMVVHHCLQVFKYGPRIAALTAEVATLAESWPEPLLTQWRRWFLLLKINAALGPVVTLLGVALIKS